MGKFTKNKRGYYQTAVTLGYDDAGHMIRKWIYARTIAELEKKILDIKTDIVAGKNLLTEDVRFGPYARMWFETYKANRGINTRAMYSHLISCQFESLAVMKIRDIRATHLQAIINEYADQPRTCEQIKLTLRQIFKQAIQDDIITKNPAASLELPRHILKEKRALTDEEKAALKAADLTVGERAFITIAYGCGLRPAEIYALTWQDIDFKNNVIHVNKSLVFDHNRPIVSYPKTNKSIRDVEMHSIVVKALKEYRATTIAPKLFCNRSGEYKGKTGYLGEWERIKRKMEAVLGHETDLTLYCFRHNFVCMLHYGGVSPEEAQRILGHTSYKMIMDFYLHLDAKKEDTLAKLNAIDF